MNTSANRFDGNVRIVEEVFLEDINVRLDFGVIRSTLSSRVICNGVNKIT